MSDPMGDPSSSVWWVLGPAIGAVLAGFGHVHARISKVEADVGDHHKAAEEVRDRDETRLWEAIDRMRADAVQFQHQVLSGMATQQMVNDLRQEVRELTRTAREGR